MAYNPNAPALTNRVQDDIAAMRDNFQHLAPLAQAVGELQAVSGLAPVAGELQAVSELAPYVQAILDSRIVEMGSNSNGEYVRWENGWQVCWFTDTISRTLTEQSGGFFYYEDAWTYPAAFVSSPTVMPGAIDNSGGLYWADLNGTPSPTSASYQLIGTHSNTARFIGIAIGRWK